MSIVEAKAELEGQTLPTHQPSENASRLRHNLRASTVDAAYYGAMVGFSENYFSAFALAVGLGQVTAGLVTSLPILCGGVSQLVALWLLRSGGSYRTSILLFVTIQALAFVPLIIAAAVGGIPAWLFYLTISVYWAGGMAAGPGWNAWISQLVPKKIRPRFFAKRTRFIQLATLSAFLFGGIVLEQLTRADYRLLGFMLLFIGALSTRLLSVWQLYLHKTTPEIDRAHFDGVTTAVAWKTLSPSAKKLILYLIILTGSLQISGPFFAPYMLVQLEFGYPYYVAIVACSFMTRIFSLHYWGIYAKRAGTQALLWTAGIAIIPLAPLWIISSNFGWILCVQAVAGVAWAGFELAVLLVFFEAIPLARRAQILTIYNFGNSVAWFCGALLGGWCIDLLGKTPHAYHFVFGLTAIARLACFIWAYFAIGSPKSLQQKFEDLESEVGGVHIAPEAPIDVRAPLITSVEPPQPKEDPENNLRQD